MAITATTALATVRGFRLTHPNGYPHPWIAVVAGLFLVGGVIFQQVSGSGGARTKTA
jgi:uncharacterized membrane protein